MAGAGTAYATVSNRGVIGEDGYVRLRAYRSVARTHYLSASCTRCGRGKLLSINRAIELLGGDDAQTVGALAKRLRCSACQAKSITIQLASDSRTPDAIKREGVLPVIVNGEADR